MERFPVGLRVDGHRADAHLAAGPDDPDGDLPAIGDEDFSEGRRHGARMISGVQRRRQRGTGAWLLQRFHCPTTHRLSAPPQSGPETQVYSRPSETVAPARRRLTVDIHSQDVPTLQPTAAPIAALERLGDEIAELSAHLEAASARLLALIREFDARGGWNNGFRSCAHWLSWRIGLDLGAAREKVRVARALGTLPLMAQALARGELPYAKVRALTRVATPDTEERLLAVGEPARRPSRSLLGARWTDHALEPRPAVPPASSRGPRGGLSARSTARWRAPVPVAGWPAPARGTVAAHAARRSGPGAPRAAREAGAPPSRAHGLPVLAGRTTGCGLGDRRSASARHSTPGSKGPG